MDISLDEIIKEGYGIANSGPTVWPGLDGGHVDRSKYVTASEIHNCPRRIKYGKLHPRNSFPNWGYAERGNLIEEWAVKMLHHAMPPGYSLMCAGDGQVSLTHGNQSGTPDGMLRTPDYKWITVEIKSIDPRTNVKKLPKPSHVWQTMQNMDLMNECVGPVVYGIIIYIDASNLQKRREYKVEWDDMLCDRMMAKAKTIIEAETPDELPAQGLHMERECDMCDYADKCSGIVERRQQEAANMKLAEGAMNNVFR